MFDDWNYLPFIPEITSFYWERDIEDMIEEDVIMSEQQWSECFTIWCMSNI